jgi:hypothetical protein
LARTIFDQAGANEVVVPFDRVLDDALAGPIDRTWLHPRGATWTAAELLLTSGLHPTAMALGATSPQPGTQVR